MVSRAVLIAVVLALVAAAPASAHPLGNFSVNHLSRVSISADRVDVRYILDQAEIPTVQERGVTRAEVLRRKLDEVARRLVLTVDGRRVDLRAAGAPGSASPAAPADSPPRAWRSSSVLPFRAHGASRSTTAPSRAASAGRRS